MAEVDIAPQFGAELKVGRLPVRWIVLDEQLTDMVA
jgi:hypothetical protein